MSTHAFAGPGSLTVAARLGKVRAPRPDYRGRRFKAEWVRTELPTEEIPKVVVEPTYLPVPKWKTWLAIVGTVAAVLFAAVVGTVVSDLANDPIPTLVRDVPTLPAYTIPGGVR